MAGLPRWLDRRLRQLSTKVANSIARGVVQLVDDDVKLQLLQIGALAGETLDECERFQEFGFTSSPLPGAEAVVIFPNGDRAHALVVAVDDRRYRPTGLPAGVVCVYSPVEVRIGSGDAAAAPALASEVLALRNATATALSGIVGGAGTPVGAVPVVGAVKVKVE